MLIMQQSHRPIRVDVLEDGGEQVDLLLDVGLLVVQRVEDGVELLGLLVHGGDCKPSA